MSLEKSPAPHLLTLASVRTPEFIHDVPISVNTKKLQSSTINLKQYLAYIKLQATTDTIKQLSSSLIQTKLTTNTQDVSLMMQLMGVWLCSVSLDEQQQ